MPTQSSTACNATRRVSAWPGWIAVCAAGIVLYGMTASRGAQWQDSGLNIWRVATGELWHPLGLALTHPLHYWLGRFAVTLGVFEPCFAVTLVSAVAAAVTVANTYGCVVTLTQTRIAALLAAVSLGLAHTFWRLATVAEIYTLVAALLSAECWCVAAYAMGRCIRSEAGPGAPSSQGLTTREADGRRPDCLVAALFFNGLGLANHMLAALTTPVLAVIVVLEIRRRRLPVQKALIGIGLWVLGSLPYTGLVVAELMGTGDLAGTLRSALFGSTYAGRVLNVVPSGRGLVVTSAFTLLSFPNWLLPAWAYGMVRARRAGIPALARRVLLADLILNALFALRYNVVDQHFFLLPLYVLMCIFGGVGFASALRSVGPTARRWIVGVAAAALVLTPAVYAAVPSVARHFNVLGGVARHKPYRDDYVYLFTPWSVVERSAERMSRHAVDLAGPNGVIIIEDPMAEYAVEYRVWRDQSDAEIVLADDTVPDHIRSAVKEGRTVVLVPARAGTPRATPPIGHWRRVGDLYTLERTP